MTLEIAPSCFTAGNLEMPFVRTVLAELVCLACLLSAAASAADTNVSTRDDPDFAVQGEYKGAIKTDDGEAVYGVQVIALGQGKFHAVAYPGGLPGDGWDGEAKIEANGETTEGITRFEGDHNRGEIKNGVLRIVTPEGASIGELRRVERKSPTLGAKPPAGAIVLFDGDGVDEFSPGRLSEDHLLMEGATTKRKFQSCQLHVEFLLPFMPQARGQGRGNSGVYLQGRYEVQMLDSFGLKGENNECGGIYSIKAPDVNMCFPPLSWQTYDIDYTAAKYENGTKVKNALMSVRHNGVPVQTNVELPHVTTAAPNPEGPDPGPIHLQDHRNPVRYRNIWVVEKP